MRSKTRNGTTRHTDSSARSSRRRSDARRRLTPIEWAAVGAISAAILAVSVSTAPGLTPVDHPTTALRVRETQTLWDIAKECSPEGMSTATTVEYIRAINGLESSAIASGQVLEVPCETSDQAVALDWR